MFEKFGQIGDVEIKDDKRTSTLITAETVDCANQILHEESIMLKDQKLRVEFKGVKY